jgi:hypothetical protein
MAGHSAIRSLPGLHYEDARFGLRIWSENAEAFVVSVDREGFSMHLQTNREGVEAIVSACEEALRNALETAHA